MGVTLPLIGMFGGAFDPPHHAHLRLARTAIAELGLARLHVIPSGDAWYKDRPLTPSEDRLALCQLAFARLARARVDDREVRRTSPSYTLDTLRELRAENVSARLVLLIGTDQAAFFHAWHGAQEILQLADIAIAVRGDAPPSAAPDDPAQALPGLQADPARIHFLHMHPMALSATMVRTRVAQGESVTDLLPPGVAAYIAHHHLYQTQSHE